tara:strand:- start:237 stop:617 length:381 start_codon:yes stop_codon:yes gene_type:complete
MSDSLIYVKAFNNLLISFNEELVKLFPSDIDIKAFKRGTQFLVDNNMRKPLQLFNEFVNEEFKIKIKKRDNSFFLENDYSSIKKQSDIELSDIILKLKNYWADLSDNNKNNIWEYLNNLVKIAELI